MRPRRMAAENAVFFAILPIPHLASMRPRRMAAENSPPGSRISSLLPLQ